jgi:hypothetical protein
LPQVPTRCVLGQGMYGVKGGEPGRERAKQEGRHGFGHVRLQLCSEVSADEASETSDGDGYLASQLPDRNAGRI